ncbi:MAG: cytochrome c [Acidobacteriota bacterium]|nr:cytochrome c [Acidobacteriota bacterium]
MTIKQAVAVLAVLAGASSASAQTAAAPGPVPTFSKDIAPIFFANCTSCHRPGEIAPMSLLTYKDARPWARSIASKVADGVMPPWHADPAHGSFSNARRLTAAEKTIIARWTSGGAPEGKAADLPAAPVYSDGWNIGQPDVVLSMQEDYPIPATGTVPYQYLEIPANFPEDRWIQAWEIKPGDRTAVHHIIVSTKAPPAPPTAQPPQARPPAAPGAPRPLPLFSFAGGTEIPAGQTGGEPLPADKRPAVSPNDRPRPRGTGPSIGGYVPGNSIRRFPEGMAMRLPAGHSLVLQMHYTPMGKATTDRTKIALKFAPGPPKTALLTASLINGGLLIPARTANHQVDAEMTINRDITLYSMVPHTHVRGIRWHYEMVYPDGRKEVILSVPKYDFNWQHEYVFKDPLKIPAGTKLQAKAWYDNSAANKSNPDPTKDVRWGDQTWEEMMYTSLTFSLAPPTAPTAGQQR